jgi:hypothetical protein
MMRQRFEEKEEAQTHHAVLIRRILLSGGVLSEADAPGLAKGTAAPADEEKV